MGKYIKNLEENVKSVLTENEALAKEAAEFLGIEQEEAAARIKPLDFVEYVELANALQMEDEEIVRSILELPVEEAAPLIGMAARAAGAAVGKAVADKVVGEDELEEGFFDMFKREYRDEEIAAWVAALFTEWGRHKAADYIAGMEADKRDFISGALDRYMADHPKGEFAPEVSWVIRGMRPLSEDECDLPMLDKPTMSLKDIAEKHGVSLAELGSELAMGIKVELEHSNDRKIAKEIALDHLMELPDYYTRLDKMENENIEEAIPKSTMYKLVRKSDNVIVDQGSKAKMHKLRKAGDGEFYVGVSGEKKVGDKFKESVNEAKAGPFKSPMLGQRVQVIYSKDAWGRDIEQGVEGTVTRAEREHTFSQMRPFVIVYTIETDDGQKIDVRREGVRKLKAVEEGDNPYVTPPSEQMPTDTIAQDDEAPLIGRKGVNDLQTGDDIEVIDIDGEPTAVTVKNPNAPGDTIVVQTDKGEEHIVKKQAVSGTPTMEELHAAYEQALGEVAPPGQEEWIKARKPEFKKRYGDDWESVLYATAWKRHNNESIEEGEEGEMKGLFVPVSADDRSTRLYPPRYIRRILDDHGVKIEGKTTVRPHPHADSGVVIRINGLKGVTDGRVSKSLAIAKDIYNKLRYVGYNVESYPTFVGSGVNVFISNENPDGRPAIKMDEDTDKIKPINKMGYAPKAGSWKKRMHKAQPPENHEKTKKRHKKLREEDPEVNNADNREEFKQKLKDPTQYYIRREYHIGKKPYDDFPAQILDTDEGDHWTGTKYKARFTDDKGETYTAWYGEKSGLSGRYYDERIVKKGERAKYVAGDSRNYWPPAGVEEGQNAGKTEHSGAKKGKGAYYGRKQDAKRDSNKKRRENDKKAVDETARLKQLAGIKETASGGATGAGAVAVGAVATGDMVSRDPGIYGKTSEKPKRKKRKTKEEKSDGIGRSRKE